jgi:hypothetical protein
MVPAQLRTARDPTQETKTPMHQKPTPQSNKDAQHPTNDDTIDRLILNLLLDPNGPGLWTEDELAQEIANETAMTRSLAQLHTAGLIHHCQELVFPSQAATRFDTLRNCSKSI